MKLEQIMQYAPILLRMCGRDPDKDIEAYRRSMLAIGTATDKQAQDFLIASWETAPDFFESEDGQKAITSFVDAWQLHALVGEQVEAEPAKPKPQAKK